MRKAFGELWRKMPRLLPAARLRILVPLGQSVLLPRRSGPLARGRGGAVAVGIRAAMAVPQHLSGEGLRALLATPCGERPAEPGDDVPPAALRAARLAVNGLGRLPGPWRATCLYRSVAECLVLRSYGVPARVRLGVLRPGDQAARSQVEAHAWVEVAGEAPPRQARPYRPLVSHVADLHGESISCWALPSDGRLIVRAEPAAQEWVEAWVPITSRTLRDEDYLGPFPPVSGDRFSTAGAREPTDPGCTLAEAVISVGCVPSLGEAPAEPPTVEVESVRAWVKGDRARLMARHAAGDVDLGAGTGSLGLREGSADGAADEIFWLLSLSSALLLGRMGRCLMHAGAVAGPDGGVWLIAADGGSGKSTLCANLLRNGWSCLSDDHVVLMPGPDEEIVAHGFLRPLGLDERWPKGPPGGAKVRVAPSAVAPAERFPSLGRVRGELVPSNTPSFNAGSGASPKQRRGREDAAGRPRPEQSLAAAMRPAEALPVLARQAGWLVADKVSASQALRLLERVAALPAYRLVLGTDAFSDAGPVLSALEEAGAFDARRGYGGAAARGTASIASS